MFSVWFIINIIISHGWFLRIDSAMSCCICGFVHFVVRFCAGPEPLQAFCVTSLLLDVLVIPRWTYLVSWSMSSSAALSKGIDNTKHTQTDTEGGEDVPEGGGRDAWRSGASS
jgi:hypothetical protein